MSDSTVERKAAVVRAAIEGGATGFTFTTCEENLSLFAYLNSETPSLFRLLNYFILTPYAFSYVAKANEQGTPALLKSTLMNSPLDLIPVALTPEKVLQLVVKQAVGPYLQFLPRDKVRAIIVHEVPTDLAVAFHSPKALKCVRDWARNMEIGFGLESRNLSYLREFLEESHLSPEYVMAPMNPLGYQMAATKKEAESAVVSLSSSTKIIAMNILASGAVSLGDAITYIRGFENEIYAVTSASSRADRIRQNFRELKAAFR
jgi:hypothetical protein